jgi:TonB family protein
MESLRFIAAILLFSFGITAVAKDWKCKDIERQIVLDNKSIAEIGNARREATYDAALPILKGTLDRVDPSRKSAVYEEIIRLSLKFNRMDEAEAATRELFNSTAANTQVRERARGDLGVLLMSIGKARDIIALYEHPDRPVCGPTSARAGLALASAFNAVGDYSSAEKVFSAAKEKALVSDGRNSYLPDSWRLLRLRLDCNQKQMLACAADFDDLLHGRFRSESLTQQLTSLLPAVRRFPELSVVISKAEASGAIQDNKVTPTKFENDGELAILSQVRPEYPRDAARSLVAGFVKMYIEINELGKPDVAAVLDSDPPGMFDQAAIDAAYKSTFKPYVVNGIPRRAKGMYRVNFALNPPAKVPERIPPNGLFHGDISPLVESTHLKSPTQNETDGAHANVSGWITLGVWIAADGSVKSVDLHDSKPPGVFDDAAIDIVKKWKYQQKLVDGVAVEQYGTQRLTFGP